ncbi:MAG TPA: DUF4398 domain-containing protein [Pseudomonadota bacterium]|nr:DUF4398 domain-containing protein [Pseudomonadota bacterium]
MHRVTFNATGDVAEARTLNAEQMAPYEFTAASQYLRRSMELAGYARFHDANNFAKKALGHAADAKKVAQRRSKGSELPIFNPRDKGMFIDKDGFVRRKSSLESGDSDFEKPPGLDNEKPPLTIDPNQSSKTKGAK